MKFLMGNEAIALGAMQAGVGLVTGYPGTPSTEILETVAKHNDGSVYVEWSVNEKSAMEVAAGASYSGVRTLVTMKQVGLNVASDPLMSLAYIGVKGGMVIVVADDPGPISSQTEQDTRHFAQFSKLPIFDPSSPEEAYEMIGDAFTYSEHYQTPVLFRPTTRVCHGCAGVALKEPVTLQPIEGFTKDSKWVIFPRLAYTNHLQMEKRNLEIGKDFSSYRFNTLHTTPNTRRAIATGGISYEYVREALSILGADCTILKISTPHPFPEDLTATMLPSMDEVLVIEELDPVIEKELLLLCGKRHLSTRILGKLTGNMPSAGENTVQAITQVLQQFLKLEVTIPTAVEPDITLPTRPPVLCAGCPHRASFYAIKKAMKERQAVFTGDIGCYTLGNAAPLEMVDTCLCMGAGITVAQGLQRTNQDVVHFAFIGDSTFFHTGISGIVNGLYNEHNMVLVVLDNGTTAMTGQQPHPGTGSTMMGSISNKISIAKTLEGLGVQSIQTVDPFNHEEAVAAAQKAADTAGISAIIFESPCVAVSQPGPIPLVNTEKCTGCQVCVQELGCPALVSDETTVRIEPTLCLGCTLCEAACPVHAIEGGIL